MNRHPRAPFRDSEDEGYQVLTAENAKIAQSLVGKHDFDLILLDIWMPDMDGISLLKEWYSHNNRQVPHRDDVRPRHH